MKNVSVKKIFLGLFSLMIVLSNVVLPQAVLARQGDTASVNCAPSAQDPFGTNCAAEFGLGERDPRDVIFSVIKLIMGFLGTVAVVIILLGGFKWMTASGSEEKVTEAKNLIIAGIIGLVIILSAYAISKFVINQMVDITNNN